MGNLFCACCVSRASAEIDALALEELILAALENKGRIPAVVRKRYKTRMPEGLVEAIEAQVRGRLS